MEVQRFGASNGFGGFNCEQYHVWVDEEEVVQLFSLKRPGAMVFLFEYAKTNGAYSLEMAIIEEFSSVLFNDEIKESCSFVIIGFVFVDSLYKKMIEERARIIRMK